MSIPSGTPSAKSLAGRRIAVALMLGGLAFFVLWLTAFTVLISVVIGSGLAVTIVVASASSDLLETLLDAFVSALFLVLAAIGAILGALLGMN